MNITHNCNGNCLNSCTQSSCLNEDNVNKDILDNCNNNLCGNCGNLQHDNVQNSYQNKHVQQAVSHGIEECVCDPLNGFEQETQEYDNAYKIFSLPFFELLYKAHTIHKENFDPQKLQSSTLMSIKTGGCGEDCAYCSQSLKNGTKMPAQTIESMENILKKAEIAKRNGSSRFCMGLSGKTQNNDTFKYICEVVKNVSKLGLETCLTAGFVNAQQALALKQSGLDYYNHNLDTSKDFYHKVITTRTFDQRLETIKTLQNAGIKLCVGGIIGLGENLKDRISMLLSIAKLSPHSLPINKLVKFPGSKLEDVQEVDEFEFIRLIALARILMPSTYVRLSAGREKMSQTMQALCFFAGANSVFSGEKLLTVENVCVNQDVQLFEKLNINFI